MRFHVAPCMAVMHVGVWFNRYTEEGDGAVNTDSKMKKFITYLLHFRCSLMPQFKEINWTLQLCRPLNKKKTNVPSQSVLAYVTLSRNAFREVGD